jgi:hypothetical protein
VKKIVYKYRWINNSKKERMVDSVEFHASWTDALLKRMATPEPDPDQAGALG